jgi:acetyltransferase-like isoleucine patch superfamily enzyme
MNPDRTLPWDWYPGKIPDNVVVGEAAYVETSFSFYLFRSQLPGGVKYGRGASTYLGTMFDVGPQGRVELGEYALVHGARIIADAEVIIGDYALISWNVVFMDTYRLPFDPPRRRRALERSSRRKEAPNSLQPVQQRSMEPPCVGCYHEHEISGQRLAAAEVPARAIRVERNVWIGFDACVLPGVTIGEGSVVGAKSVVTQNVPPFTIVAGNPARVIRKLANDESRQFNDPTT